ncbi:hypothetical protein SAMN02910456_00398 [Ruminococcaceae bacterium YRB3002]|nr:hypothetical protein SAMN02910456_00398 [Ruminococcaceae bacterium YRB3002]
MNYFFANLIAHASVCIVLIVLMVIFTNRNFKRKTKHVLAYFFPVVLLLFIGFDVSRYLAPRMFDIYNVLNSVTYTHTGKVQEVSGFHNYFVVDGEKYFINPTRGDLEVGQTVRVKYTPSSHYAISVSRNDEDPE